MTEEGENDTCNGKGGVSKGSSGEGAEHRGVFLGFIRQKMRGIPGH